MTADGTPIPLAGVGSIVTPHLSLPNVYLIPKLKLNLASVSQICDSGDYLVMFSSSFCCLHAKVGFRVLDFLSTLLV
jgi:hypothetical protein